MASGRVYPEQENETCPYCHSPFVIFQGTGNIHGVFRKYHCTSCGKHYTRYF